MLHHAGRNNEEHIGSELLLLIARRNLELMARKLRAEFGGLVVRDAPNPAKTSSRPSARLFARSPIRRACVYTRSKR